MDWMDVFFLLNPVELTSSMQVCISGASFHLMKRGKEGEEKKADGGFTILFVRFQAFKKYKEITVHFPDHQGFKGFHFRLSDWSRHTVLRKVAGY